MSDELEIRYAELLVKAGVDLKPGQTLVIRTPPENYSFTRCIAETAYRLGAGAVELHIQDDHLIRARLETQSEKALKYGPRWLDSWQEELVSEGWALISLENTEDQGVLEGVDPKKQTVFNRAGSTRFKRFADAVMSSIIPWCVASVPGERWAGRVLGPSKTTEDLWEILAPILKLDSENPIASWRTQSDVLLARAFALNSLKLDALRFVDEGTDLTVGLNPGARWVGGPDFLPDKRPFLSNIPTEEVFTVPDRLRTTGRVKITRPVEVQGAIVEGAVFTFEDGVLTHFDAVKGVKALSSLANIDDGARRLGEVALVGSDSPIAESGLLFGSTLYDENAACHIALGRGFSFCFEHPETMKNEESRLAAGCNQSLVHKDFMIGSSTTTVTGTRRDGFEITIIENGKFVI